MPKNNVLIQFNFPYMTGKELYYITIGEPPMMDSVSKRLIRLPLWVGISYERQVRVIDCLADLLGYGHLTGTGKRGL